MKVVERKSVWYNQCNEEVKEKAVASFEAIIMTNQNPEYSGMTKACLVDRLKQRLATVNGHIPTTDTGIIE